MYRQQCRRYSNYIYSVMGWVCVIHSSFEPWSNKEKIRFHRISVHEMMKSSQITFTMSSDLYVLPIFNTKKDLQCLPFVPPQTYSSPNHTPPWTHRPRPLAASGCYLRPLESNPWSKPISPPPTSHTGQP